MEEHLHTTARTTLRLGDWQLDTISGVATRDGGRIQLEPRALALLLRLAERPGEVVSIDALLARGWPDVIVSQDSVYQAITSLRRQLGDDPRQPRYIATVPRLGYRLIADVSATTPLGPVAESPGVDGSPSGSDRTTIDEGREGREHRPSRVPVRIGLWLVVMLLAASAVAAYQLTRPVNTETPSMASLSVLAPARLQTLAVLPFLDLTDAMNEEPFADGMTEELIVRLSKVPGLKVSAPTASFQFKDKQVPVPEIARSLGVSYLLDGSVRKSERTLRVSVRLLRADDGFVVWSDTYDRPHEDKLAMQDQIAGEVTSALERLAPRAADSPAGR